MALHRFRAARIVRPDASGALSRGSVLPFLAGAAGIAILLFTYYRITWRSFAHFQVSIDRASGMFSDFTGYYYPMGEAVIRTGLPVEGFLYSPFIAVLLAVFSPARAGSIPGGVGDAAGCGHPALPAAFPDDYSRQAVGAAALRGPVPLVICPVAQPRLRAGRRVHPGSPAGGAGSLPARPAVRRDTRFLLLAAAYLELLPPALHQINLDVSSRGK